MSASAVMLTRTVMVRRMVTSTPQTEVTASVGRLLGSE
jgi:hypothetical protein